MSTSSRNVDVSELLLTVSLSLSSIKSIKSSREALALSEETIDIVNYYPLTTNEYEIQCFNITLAPPLRLSNEKIADWILETKTLRRKSVALYLTGGLSHNNTNDKYKDQAEQVLELLALRVCSLDVAKSFTDGLALFMPTVGASDLFLELYSKYDNNDNDVLGYNDRLLTLYTTYCKAHMSTSSTPLFTITIPNISGGQSLKEYINVAIALCFLIVATCQQLDVRVKQEATILSEFIENLRTIFIEESMNVPPLKTIHDMFNDAKGAYSRLITPLPLLESVKSYLFADSNPCQGWVTCCYNAEEHKQVKLWAIVTQDAIYFFDVDTSFDPQYYCFPEAFSIHSCLPLQYVNISIGDGQNHNKIEVWPYDGNLLPLIRMSETVTIDSDGGITTPRTFHELSKLAYPEKVSYHQSIYIDINTDSDDDNSYLHRWVDILDQNAWNCRNTH